LPNIFRSLGVEKKAHKNDLEAEKTKLVHNKRWGVAFNIHISRAFEFPLCGARAIKLGSK